MKCSHCGREISPEEQSFAEANFGNCLDCEDRPINFDCLLSEHDLWNRWHVSRRYRWICVAAVSVRVRFRSATFRSDMALKGWAP
jgi:hypothetical protein